MCKLLFTETILLSVVFILSFTETRVHACSAFTYTKDGQTVVGNNEDWDAGNPTIKVYPEKDGEFGRIYITYWWGLFWMPFAGVNEHGLMYDIFIADTSESVTFVWGKSLRIGFGLATKAMKTCKSVEDVVELFEQSNLIMPGYQLFFTDRQGDSVIIGGGQCFRKELDYQVVTNHLIPYQIEDPRGLASDDSKARYRKMEDSLQQLQSQQEDPNGRQVTLEDFANICKSVSKSIHGENGEKRGYPTRYSYLLDLKNLKMYLFRVLDNDSVDYENTAVLDIIDEISEGRQSFELNDLDYRPLESCSLSE